ncbi:MAG: HNH endonuclease signature motif containing protein [Nostoc sp. DedVER02]|uniref:HNH endonuclease n=1 Tax=unclassified Nostoc TaxID=2593658 RepID=UPI002AD5B234|nr:MULTISPECIES: HNH endonuclease signature motif containing protein [unclassified Nostoc]MDZ7984504.1 HNH endonuclease signature motif containing protein [Nostoc sp. DedVER02]MDZ8115390.1 HNH endonuclease signature motif containing protein [Nostoc sp. DedVER01b]
MSVTYIPVVLRRLVEERANYRCEYCQLPAGVAFFPHEIDHVIAQKHGGVTNADNLALTCWRCNRHKGTDLGSFDPETGAFSFLFNPRIQKWAEHFSFLELDLVGLTPIGRTTIRLLQINSDERLAERRRLR